MKFINFITITVLFFLFLFSHVTHMSAQEISYSFKNQILSKALDSLIFNYNVPLLYLHRQVENIWISGQCKNCSHKEALKKLLKSSTLDFKEVNGRFILYNPQSETVYLQSDEKKAITGKVLDSLTNKPLPFASVIIEDNKGVATDKDGSFTLDQLSSDIYKLKILYLGYTSDSILVDLRHSQKYNIENIKLSPKSTEIDVVVVKTNEIQKNPISSDIFLTTMNSKQLKKIPTMEPGDIIQNIKLLPEISSLPDNLTGFTLRGSTIDQTLVTLDGIPLYHTVHLWGFNSFVNSNAIETVNIKSGGVSAKYGDYLSGVIEMKGLDSDKDRVSGSLYTSLFSAKTQLSVPIIKKATLSLSTNKSLNIFDYQSILLNRKDYMFINKYDRTYDGEALAIGSTFPDELDASSNYYDLYSKLEVSTGKNDKLTVNAIYNFDKILINAETYAQSNVNRFKGEREETWKTTGIHVVYYKEIGTLLKVQSGSLFTSYTNSSNFNYSLIDANHPIGIWPMNHENLNSIKQFKYYIHSRWQISNNSTFLSGLEFKRFNTMYQQLSKDDSEIFFYVKQDWFSNQAQANEYIAYTEEEIHILNSVGLKLGTRFTYTENINKFFIEPRISTKIMFGDYFSTQASWGKYHQNLLSTPSFISLNIASYNSSNVWLMTQSGLIPSTSEDWLTAITFKKNEYSIRLSAYYKLLNNLSFFIPTGYRMAPIEKGNPGHELFLKWAEDRKFIKNQHEKGNSLLLTEPEVHSVNSYRLDYFSGRGKSAGMEIFASKDKGIYTAFISYHLGKTNYQFPYINFGKEFIAEFDRTHELRIMNSILWRKWNLGCIFSYVSGKPFPSSYKVLSYFSSRSLAIDHPITWDLSNTKRTKPFQSVDLSLSKTISNLKVLNFVIGVTVHNVFNWKNELAKYNITTVDAENNNIAVLSEEMYTQYGIGRLFNTFINIEF